VSFLTDEQLAGIGFRSIGCAVNVSDGARFYGAGRIDLGDHCRIDDFALLSAGADGISIGRYVHIACFCSLQGDGAIVFEDYSGLSSRVAIYSSSDDFSGAAMAHPTIPAELRQVETAPVRLERHALVGAGSVILPGVVLRVGSAVGALSLVRETVPPFTIVAGVPATVRGERRRDLLGLERRLENRG
jgi:acetyltransferase-like isoleucine patch superfamily enzyme